MEVVRHTRLAWTGRPRAFGPGTGTVPPPMRRPSVP